jgi:hypothetical protein
MYICISLLILFLILCVLQVVCCAETGVMLYIEIQRGKDTMRKQKYSSLLGATAGCTLRLAEGSAYCGQSNPERVTAKEKFKPNLFVCDAWFGSVVMAEHMKTLRWTTTGEWKGHKVIAAVKTNHSRFPKAELEEKMKDYPSGSYLVLECTTPTKQVKLLAIGYKYNARKILLFVATKNAGSTKPGTPYKAKFPDKFGNTKERLVIRPAVVSQYFDISDAVDSHNHARQYLLALEKRWVTHNPWFRIDTTIIGMTVVDAWKCLQYHLPRRYLQYTAKQVADCIAWDCVNNKLCTSKTSSLEHVPQRVRTIAPPNPGPLGGAAVGASSAALLLQQLQGLILGGGENINLESTISPLSSNGGSVSRGGSFSGRRRLFTHCPIQNPDKAENKRGKKRRCQMCKTDTRWMLSILLVGRASTLVASLPSLALFSAKSALVSTNSKSHNLKKCKKNKEL